jgi:biopolymer transport protein ExbD
MMAASYSPGYSDDDDGAMSAINVTPLVDVTLVLLIVFMITVPVIVGTARVKVDLPETTNIRAEPQPQQPLAFTLKPDAGGRPVLYLNETPIDEAGVRALFERDRGEMKDQAVSFSADKTLPYGEIVKIVDLLESFGLKKLSLETRHVESR